MRRARAIALRVGIALVIIAIGIGAFCVSTADSSPTTAVVPSPTEDSATVDYRGGAWWVDGQRVSSIDCPTKDSCAVDYRNSGWYFTEVTP
jgi:hypothetical protein